MLTTNSSVLPFRMLYGVIQILVMVMLLFSMTASIYTLYPFCTPLECSGFGMGVGIIYIKCTINWGTRRGSVYIVINAISVPVFIMMECYCMNFK